MIHIWTTFLFKPFGQNFYIQMPRTNIQSDGLIPPAPEGYILILGSLVLVSIVSNLGEIIYIRACTAQAIVTSTLSVVSLSVCRMCLPGVIPFAGITYVTIHFFDHCQCCNGNLTNLKDSKVQINLHAILRHLGL